MKSLSTVIIAALVVFVGSAGYWYYSTHTSAFPPKSNVCFDMLKDSIESAKSNSSVVVPDFSLASLKRVRCTAVPGFTNFEIVGTDSSGKDFHIFQTAGGKAASGGDSIFDYCYVREGKTVSQIRITGRESTHSDSACAYDESFLPNAEYSYEYGF